MKGGLPESTGLPGSGLSPRRQEQVAWLRQAGGVFRAAGRARLLPAVLAGRLSWLLAAQAVLAGVAAWGVHQAGVETVPPEAASFVSSGVLLLLLIHALGRLGSVNADALRDVDEQVLDTYDASPLASSAYVAGRTAFHLVEQAIGFVALLPAFGLAHALRGLEWRGLIAIALALAAVSLVYCLAALGRVLRAHARRPRGLPLPPSLRPGAGALVALALLGGAFAAAALTGYVQGAVEAAPLLLALSLTPAVPIVTAAGGASVQLFGASWPLWLPAVAWLLALAPLAWGNARLRWKPPVQAAGVPLRVGFVLAWLAPALVLSATLRGSVDSAVLGLLLMAGAGALIPGAWAGGSELSGLGDRPGARRRGLLGQHRATAAPWALLLHGVTLVLMAMLAPPGPGRGDWLLLALACFAATAPTLIVAAALARRIGPSRGTVFAVLLMGAVLAGLVSAVPELVALFERVPVVGGLARASAGPANLLAASSPAVALQEAAAWVLGRPGFASWVEVPAPWNAGLPTWACGTLVQAALGLPLAAWLARGARRLGR